MIRGARQLLTLRGSRGPRCGPDLNDVGLIRDGSLLVRDGVLLEVGPTRRVENLTEARDAEEVNAAGRVVMPGLVDCHTHLAFPLAEGPADPRAAAHKVAATNGQRLEIRVREYLQAMARHGTTTVEAKTGCGPDEAAEMKLLRVLAAVKRDPLDVLATFQFRIPAGASSAEAEAAADWAIGEFLPKIAKRRLIRFAEVAWEDAAHGVHYARFLAAARKLGLACKVHADRDGAEEPITRAVENFAVTADHLELASPEARRLLAGSCTLAALLPCGWLHGGGSAPPARELIDSGVAVALGSNFNPLEAPTFNMQTVAALASVRMGLTPEEAIAASTINAAHALGRADSVGSLEPGKRADVLILNASDYRELARDFGSNLVRMTMKRGEFIYREGDVRTSEDRRRELPLRRQ